MQCKTCEYPLWNLKARQCPECGKPFLPSEHEFIINSVRFCCPHCNQGYYGTSQQGHLEPPEFDCVTCGQHITMDQMVLLPAEGLQDHDTKIEQAPWLHRERIGRMKAWFSTVFQGLFLPHKLIRGVPAESGVGQAWWYAILTSALFTCVNVITFIAFIYLITTAFGGNQGMSGLAGFGFGMLITFASVWIGLILLMLVWGLVTHGALLVIGGATYPIGRTFQAICYSIGGAALIAVPFIGIYPFGFIPLLWWMVSAMVMVSIAHGAHPGKAIIATGVFPFVMTILVIGGLFALFYFSMTMAQTTLQRAANSASTNAALIVQQQLIPAAEENGGAYPAFGMIPISDGTTSTIGEYVSPFTITDDQLVMIGDVSLSDMRMMDADELTAHIDAVRAAMPDDVVAHRIGDMVFTYHGITLDTTDSSLWIVVLVQPADAVIGYSGSPFSNQVTVVMADGSTISHPMDQFFTALENQNALRTSMGLPELPDPRGITLKEPIVRANGERQAYQGSSP